MNKKGFTLVEMLVVIAIIAVLVAIIVPTAVSATKKAAAATNAANLRSYAAEIAIELVSNGNDKAAAYAKITAPKSKAVQGVVNGDLSASFYINANGEVVAYFLKEANATFSADITSDPTNAVTVATLAAIAGTNS